MLPEHNKLQYILFDWDGTLADNRDVVVNSMQKTLKEYNLPDWNIVKAKRNSKLSLRDNFTVFFGKYADEAYEKYVQTYKLLSPKIVRAFTGAHNFLHLVKNEGIELIIMTNKDRRLLDIELPLLYNPSLFARIVCGHEALRDKPYPEHIFYALQGFLSPFEINKENVWMIGDSDQDSDCALSAGALPIRINQNIFADNKYVSQNIVYFKDFNELAANFTENYNV